MEDIYIATIRKAIEHNDEISMLSLFNELDLTDSQRRILTIEIEKGNILSHKSVSSLFQYEPEKVQVWASAHDRFRLLEHEELQEARQQAAGANKHAGWAIGISIFSAVLSASLTLWQIIDDASDTTKTHNHLQQINSTMEMIEARALLRNPVSPQNQARQSSSPTPAAQ